MTEDDRWMRLALSLGARGAGLCWPNPAVGCVIVKDGHVKGRGWTQPGGRPHAEVVALAQAGATARGATAYVTLEPCAHTGQTGPCATALIDAGIARIVGGTQDPDPRVGGAGFAMLEAAGVSVTRRCLEAEARAAHEGFLTRVTQGRPKITLKLASSLDGRIATGSGDSRWITGPEARRRVHQMRSHHDAVLVGSGTALADDPDLQVRDLGATRQPVRIVFDSRLRLPADSRLIRSAREEAPVWILHGPQARTALQAPGLRLIPCAAGPNGLDIAAALQALGAAGLTSVFCEGGGQLAASLVSAGCVDQLVTFEAGLVIGAEGQPAFGAMGHDRLHAAPRFRLEALSRVGADVLAVWRPARP